ncbi:MAG: hypothetical protein R3C68_06305 [Myxococcota bacterium]
MREAKLRIETLYREAFNLRQSRGLDPGQIAQLQTCQWVGDHRNVIVTGYRR